MLNIEANSKPTQSNQVGYTNGGLYDDLAYEPTCVLWAYLATYALIG
jgi:hypothetical protein